MRKAVVLQELHFAPHGGEVHGLLDQVQVVGHLVRVHRLTEDLLGVLFLQEIFKKILLLQKIYIPVVVYVCVCLKKENSKRKVGCKIEKGRFRESKKERNKERNK